MKNKIPQFIILALVLYSSFALAQSPCDNPVPDTCQGPPYMWCSVPPDRCPWDMNFNGIDIVFMVNYFKGFGHPANSGMMDLNCDGRFNLIDILYLVNYFKGRGPAPQCCVYICQAPPPSSLGNFVWNDLDMDGVQDEGEPGIANDTVRLYNCLDTLYGETITDASGHYAFGNLAGGEYKIHFSAPSDYRFSPKDQGVNDSLDSDVNIATGYTDCFILPDGTEDLTRDAGMYHLLPKSSVGDYVWFDADSNGIQNAGEHGIGGVNVQLLNCNGDALDSMKTDSTGFFLFVNLNQGDYKLHFTSPFGYRFSPPDQGSNDSLDSDVDPETGLTPCITLGFAEQADIWDAGMYQLQGENCTRVVSFWKNHAGFGHQEDIVTPLLPLWLGDSDSTKSIHVTTAQIASDILQMHIYGDPSNGISKLYAQLLAAQLNIANDADGDAIANIIDSVDTFLSTHDWHDWDGLSRAEKRMVQDWRITLQQYNGGEIGPGPCEDGNINLR